MSFPKHKPHYKHLSEKWTKRNENYIEKLMRDHKDSFEWLVKSTKQIAVSSLAGLFIISSPLIMKLNPITASAEKSIDRSVFLVSDLSHVLPDEAGPLSNFREKEIEEILSRTFNLKVKAELNGIRLNTTYGKIGAEQHLARFPGDNMSTHFDNEEDANSYWSSGMAPGLGGWGYFANSGQEITNEDSMREKYYIAVQTFLAPGFNENRQKYLDFFKFRKMLVVNPHNGKAVVVVIGDAGPAQWTGKQLGGSPEVMKYLERYDGRQVRGVLYFFIDDPNNEVPLGPIGYN
ncbi:MAG: hypothetical protein A2152_02530 [Candidatus Levybacteria bacterium RBG_16_35_6]|nr:MAG: hypothetical protein A2152_02530 [Candidatus Levybacteria bacterium RBG_16_35_6]